jgi:hypothetical protein
MTPKIDLVSGERWGCDDPHDELARLRADQSMPVRFTPYANGIGRG